MIAATLLAVAVWLGFLAKAIVDFKTALRDFPLRRAEARQTIEFVYSHHARHGQWPTLTEIQSQNFGALANGWQVSTDAQAGAPTMWLHGPYHMNLVYYFEPPQQEVPNVDWTLSVEGDKRHFKEAVPYSVE